ncbi:MAG: acetyl-CoA carboxylase, carboxyltransferase subunit beta [bacterium]
MPWFKRPKEERKAHKRREIPDGLWVKCDGCGEILYKKELEKNLWVCGKCDYHFRISSRQYAAILLDKSFVAEMNGNLGSIDFLNFPEYRRKLKVSAERSGAAEAITSGEGTIDGKRVVMAIMDFGFMGGSMGSVVGEKVARSVREAKKRRIPLIAVCASGGARMQEGIISLMQMAKTSASLAELSREGIAYISVLTNPTTAGVMASYGSLGDIIIAEPGALIGFAGQRVIKQTIGEELPEGFQRSEFLIKHGMIDMLVHRKELKRVLSTLLDFLGEQ